MNKLFNYEDKKDKKDKNCKISKVKNEIFNRHVKLKKRHEIVRLSQLTDQILGQIPDCNTIVDCGSGQGHLSRILSLCYGYNVISIEADSENVSGAAKKDNRILQALLRYKLTQKSQSDCPQKLNHILSQTSSVHQMTNSSDNHVLLGLHACGPLSHTILRQFANCDSAKALILVSCCYMKIDINRLVNVSNNFSLFRFL